MKTKKNAPIFYLFNKHIEKFVFIEVQYGITFEDVQVSGPIKVCKVIGIVFRCREDANNFKNSYDLFGVKITHFNTFYSIYASK